MPALQAEIAKLPLLAGTGINVATRTKEVLDHLNSVLRFYRTAMTPMQKVGEPSDVLYAEESSTEATQIAQLAFQAGKNEAALLGRVAGGTAVTSAETKAAATRAPGEAQRLAATQAQAEARVEALEAQQASRRRSARPGERNGPRFPSSNSRWRAVWSCSGRWWTRLAASAPFPTHRRARGWPATSTGCSAPPRNC